MTFKYVIRSAVRSFSFNLTNVSKQPYISPCDASRLIIAQNAFSGTATSFLLTSLRNSVMRYSSPFGVVPRLRMREGREEMEREPWRERRVARVCSASSCLPSLAEEDSEKRGKGGRGGERRYLVHKQRCCTIANDN